MKRIIFILPALCAMFVSCQQEMSEIITQGTRTIDISFAIECGYELSRGYFDSGTVSEPWEKELKSVEIFVSQSAKIFLRRSLTPEELSAGKLTLSIPDADNSNWGLNPVQIYFIANLAVPSDITDTKSLEKIIDDLPVMYNSPSDAASRGPKWETGFTMTAKHTLSSTAANHYLSVTLKRTVSKIAVRVTVDPDLSQLHQGGKLEITHASVVRTASDCMLFPGSVELPSAMDFDHSIEAVESETVKEFIFYVFPNNSLSFNNPNNPAVVIEGIFDRDGDPATTGDLFDVKYELLIGNPLNSTLLRNKMYRYDLNVTGLNGEQVQSSFRIEDWLAPDTQEIEAGN